MWGFHVARLDGQGVAKAFKAWTGFGTAPRLSQNNILLLLIINMLQMLI